ncbi:MAG TPA: oligosaccharide flippase family protein [Burkholderiaceae bacterium]|nr:oligosaccharide flippase family protein [Burkholderiaceae bacterium]
MLKRLLIDNALLALQYATSALVPLLLIPYFIHVLGAAQYGAIAIAVAVLSYASVVVQYAFHLTGPAELAARAQAGTGVRANKEVFLDIALARLLLLAGVIAVGAAAALVFFFVADQGKVERHGHWWVLLGLPIGAALHSGWYLQATGRLLALSATSIVAAGCTLAVGFLLVDRQSASAHVWAAAALALGPLLAGCATFVHAAMIHAGEPGKASLARALEAIRQGRSIFLSQFIAALYTLAGPLVVGSTAGQRAAGLYSGVERIANALQTAFGLTHTAAYPRLAALYRTARSEYLRLVRAVLAIYLLGVLGLGVLLAFHFERVSILLLAEANTETVRLLGCAWLWLALGIFGPLVTGYLTVSDARREILPLTWRVLLVSLPAGFLAATLFGSPGWLAALVAGQLLVVRRAARAYRDEAAHLKQQPGREGKEGSHKHRVS